MNSLEFSQLISKHPYHIMVWSSPLPCPLNFAIHTRIVLITPEHIHRRDIHNRQWKDAKQREGFLYLNYQNPRSGWLKGGWFKDLFKGERKIDSSCLHHIQGGKELLPTIEQIEQLIKDYPHKHYYRLLGINSNSFTQYLLDKSGIEYKLPWNAFGKKL